MRIDREGGSSIVAWIGVKDRLPESAWQMVIRQVTVERLLKWE